MTGISQLTVQSSPVTDTAASWVTFLMPTPSQPWDQSSFWKQGSGAHSPGGPRSEGGKGRERRWRRSPSEPGGPRRPQTPVRQATVWPAPRRAHSSWERLEMQMRHAGLPGGKAAAAPRHVRVNRPRRCFCGAADRKAEAGGAEGPVRRGRPGTSRAPRGPHNSCARRPRGPAREPRAALRAR